MSAALKAGVIGTGVISEEHLRFLRDRDDVRLIGVCDLSPSVARFAAERFDADAPFTEYRRMLEEVVPDVVHVLTPPATHARITADCIAAGADVIVEKPVAPTRGEFHDLWSAAERAGRYLVEDHNYRFNEPILEIERMVADGTLGEVAEVEVRMALGIRRGGRYSDENMPHPSHRLPAGVVHEFLPHLAYLALLFLPSVDRVAAAWSNHGGGDMFRYDDLDAIVVGGSVHARLRFSAATQPDCFSVTVRGTRGTASTDLFQPYINVAVPRGGPEQLTPVINQYRAGKALKRAARRNLAAKILQKTPYEGLATFLDRTYVALRERSAPPVGFDDMDGTLALVESLLDEANRV